jgi:hypothetical protein
MTTVITRAFWEIVGEKIGIPDAIPVAFFVGYPEPPLGAKEAGEVAVQVICRHLALILQGSKPECQLVSVNDLGDDFFSTAIDMARERILILLDEQEKLELSRIVKDFLQNILDYLMAWVLEGENFYEAYWCFIEATAIYDDERKKGLTSPEEVGRVIKQIMTKEQYSKILEKMMKKNSLAAERIKDEIPAVGNLIEDIADGVMLMEEITRSATAIPLSGEEEIKKQMEEVKINTLKEMSEEFSKKGIVVFEETVDLILQAIYG